jgi:thiamine-phosphate pyrophosphorylase
VLLYYITDRRQIGDEGALLECIAGAVRAGVDYIQLRERDLTARALEQLARRAVEAVCAVAGHTRLLINSRSDVAIAAGAHGVHLRGDDISAADARALLHQAGMTDAVVAVSCHTMEEVALAESHGADFVVFGPVFEKDAAPGQGLAALHAACSRKPAAAPPVPVLALGGVTLANAAQALAAGAAGLAGIRLFQKEDIAETVRALRTAL